MTGHNKPFPGFPPEPFTNFWPYPRALNGYWKELTPTEQKVLDYILRHTWGYQKNEDSISLSQFIYGITKRDGTVVDGGTGIKSEDTVRKALRGLETKKFITTKFNQGRESTYSLRIDYSENSPLVGNVTTTPFPKVGGDSSQILVPTINKTIKDNNINSPTGQEIQKSPKTEITFIIGYLSQKLGDAKFPNYGKQAKYAKSMLDVGYSTDDITWTIDRMLENPWWRDNSFDLKNVADEIPKQMNRVIKGEKK